VEFGGGDGGVVERGVVESHAATSWPASLILDTHPIAYHV